MALRVSESKFWDHFSIQTSPQNPQKDTLGTQIGPRKVIFGHFAFFEYFYLIFFEHSLSTGRIFQMQTPSSKWTFFGSNFFFLASWCIDPVGFSVFCRFDHFSFWGPALLDSGLISCGLLCPRHPGILVLFSHSIVKITYDWIFLGFKGTTIMRLNRTTVG